jgi:aryl-phospho-beta-D-glucosidase BglC (GH1 family)
MERSTKQIEPSLGRGEKKPSRFLVFAAAMACLAAAAQAAAASPPRVIVDFKRGGDVSLRPAGAKATLLTVPGGRALQIVTEASPKWPSVYIQPRAGKWDLSGFDAVETDIVNPEERPVRVLLSVCNPGSDGRNGCNTESVTVPGRGRAKLTVPFGNWHGETGHDIDLKNIVAVQVLLDRPGRSHRFNVGEIRAVRFDREEMKAVFAEPFFQELKPAFGRGVNLANALESPKEGEWGVVLKEEYFEKIKQAGFESIRLPVCWPAHAEESAPYRIDLRFVARVDWAIEQALKRKLPLILDMHNYDGVMQAPDRHEERFLALWQQIAEHYKDYPPALAFELLNEPHDKLTAEKWNSLLAKTIAVVRRTNPDRQIVVGPVGWNGIGELQRLELPADDHNLIVTVHYYLPFQFTHQGANWVGPGSEKWLGTKWTGTKREVQAVGRDLDTAIAWAVAHRRPIYLGEFGAYSKADLASRARWTRCVADEAVSRKMGFGYWEFCAGFGVYDPEKHQWIEPLKEALLPAARR